MKRWPDTPMEERHIEQQLIAKLADLKYTCQD